MNYKLWAILGLAGLLIGCAATPEKLGISEQQWQSMSETQRQQVLANYEKAQETKHEKTIYEGPHIVVQLSGGTAAMPPFTQAYAYQPVQFSMKPGQCRTIHLESQLGEHATTMRSCYNGLTLALDPSRYDPVLSNGSLRFNYSPLWKRGFAYRGVSSNGYVHLTKVNVTIHAINDHIVPTTGQTVSQEEPAIKPKTTAPASATQPLSVVQPVISQPPLAQPPVAEKAAPVAEVPNSTEHLAPVEDVHHTGS